MQTTRFSAVALLAVGGILMFASFGAWLLFSPFWTNSLADRELENLSNFQIGQYYFNHDDDPAGLYDIAKAQDHFQKAVAQDPSGNKLAWYQLGRTFFIQGKFSDALYSFDKQLEYFGDTVPNVYYMIGLTYGYQARQTGSTDHWNRAQDAFITFIDFAPKAPWSRVDLAWIYFAQGKFSEMVPVLEEGLIYEPDNPWLLNMYGLALMNTGKRESAALHFHKAKSLAAALTAQEWGRSYPGNDPDAWAQGLQEFRDIIDKNLALVEP